MLHKRVMNAYLLKKGRQKYAQAICGGRLKKLPPHILLNEL